MKNYLIYPITKNEWMQFCTLFVKQTWLNKYNEEVAIRIEFLDTDDIYDIGFSDYNWYRVESDSLYKDYKTITPTELFKMMNYEQSKTKKQFKPELTMEEVYNESKIYTER